MAGNLGTLENERRTMIRRLRCRTSASLLSKINATEITAAKSAEESLVLRGKARFLFQRDKHDRNMHETICGYATASVAWAPVNSESLALAYTERSRLLHHTKYYRECIADCNRALAIAACPIPAKIAAHSRKIECSLILGMKIHETEFEEAHQACIQQHTGRELGLLSFPQERKLKFVGTSRGRKLMKVPIAHQVDPENERDNVEPTTEAVEIRANSQWGRYLVATRNINCGEVVLVEPYYAVGQNPTVVGRTCCRHCLKIAWAAVPCDTCNDFVYCSESCRDEAWKEYHDFECPLMHAIPEYKVYVDDNVTLALKLVLKAIKDAGSIKNLKKIVAEIDACSATVTRGMTNDEFIGNFRAFYSLMDICPKDSNNYVEFISILIVIGLAKFTHLFGPTFSFDSCSDLARDHDVVFIGALLMRMIPICINNSKKFLERNTGMKSDLNGKIVFYRMVDYSRGQVLTPYASFINHSCNPNVYKLQTERGKLMYFSIMPIPKGEQIFECYYHPFYSTKTLNERRSILYDYYRFTCQCDACSLEWAPTPSHPDNRVEHLEMDPELFKDIEIAGPLTKEMRELLAGLIIRDYSNMSGIRRTAARAIEALTVFPFPNPVTMTFVYALRYAFEHTHSTLSINMPAKCNWMTNDPGEMTPDKIVPMTPPTSFSEMNLSKRYNFERFGY